MSRFLAVLLLLLPALAWAQSTPPTYGPGSVSTGGGGGSVSITAANSCIVVTPSPLTGTGTVGITVADNTKTTSYSAAAGDMCGALNLAGSGATLTLPAASGTVFAPGMTLNINVTASAAWTLTNSTGLTLTGLNSTSLAPGTSGTFVANADGTHLDFFPGAQSPTTTALGGVLSKDCNAVLSGDVVQKINPDGTVSCVAPAGGVTKIAGGTSAMGTGAISSGTCATVVTTSATGVATTDPISWGFNGDPTGVTGYVPLTSGMLTIIAYPSSNNVNFKVCNNTSGSITPGAITLNWLVVR